MTPDVEARPDRTRLRKWIALLLVVVSAISVLASVVAVWAHQTIFDTDNFMETIEPVLEDPAVTTALGNFVTEEVTEALDLESRLQEPLADLDAFLAAAVLGLIDNDRLTDLLEGMDRPSLEALAAPIADRFNERIADTVDDVMTSSQVQELIPRLIRRAHEATVALLRGDLVELPNVSVAEGEVRLNLLPVVATVLQRIVGELRELLPNIQLPTAISSNVDEALRQYRESLGDRVPDDFGQVAVMSEDRLSELQGATERADRWVWGIVLLSVVLVVLALVVSPTRRRTAIQIALGVVVALLLGFAVVRRVEAAVLDEIANPATAATASSVVRHLLSGLRAGVRALLILGVLTAVVLYLVGRPKWVTSTGDRVATVLPGSAGSLDGWIAAHFDVVRLAAIAIAVLALFMTGLSVLSVMIVVGLLAVILWWLTSARDRAAAQPTDLTTSSTTS